MSKEITEKTEKTEQTENQEYFPFVPCRPVDGFIRRGDLKPAYFKGKQFVRGGELIVTERFLTRSDRRISLYGGKS